MTQTLERRYLLECRHETENSFISVSAAAAQRLNGSRLNGGCSSHRLHFCIHRALLRLPLGSALCCCTHTSTSLCAGIIFSFFFLIRDTRNSRVRFSTISRHSVYKKTHQSLFSKYRFILSRRARNTEFFAVQIKTANLHVWAFFEIFSNAKLYGKLE